MEHFTRSPALARRFAVLLTAALLLGLFAFPVLGADTFTDIGDSWAKEEIEAAAAHGYILGYEDRSFLPADTLTLEQWTVIVARMLELDAGREPLPKFNRASDWARVTLTAADNAGLLKNVRSTAYDRGITRYDMAAVTAGAVRYLGITYSGTGSELKDVSADRREDVSVCTGTGLINGYPDNTFGGSNTLTRQEGAAVIMRLHRLAGDAPKTQPGAQAASVPQKSSRPEDMDERFVFMEGIGWTDNGYDPAVYYKGAGWLTALTPSVCSPHDPSVSEGSEANRADAYVISVPSIFHGARLRWFIAQMCSYRDYGGVSAAKGYRAFFESGAFVPVQNGAGYAGAKGEDFFLGSPAERVRILKDMADHAEEWYALFVESITAWTGSAPSKDNYVR